ncbi:hypothetical protein PVL29_006674 [Vitis rotundifolia]|nr:hypothetical protein PVL29_006674 [Vitis rotundifolia]
MPSSSKLSKKPFLSQPQDPSKTPTPDPKNPKPKPDPNPFTPSPQNLFLSKSSCLSRQDVLRRRSHHMKQLWKCYRDYYWSIMEEVKIHHREYYWKYGVSPIMADQSKESGVEGNGGSNGKNDELGFDGDGGGSQQCASVGCKTKAMALTRFCYLHILCDPKQQLYKPCDYVIKRAQTGPITCGKPILKSSVPDLCTVHLQKAQKHLHRALKKSGFNVASSSKPAPKFHVIAAEYVHQIQEKRRAAQRANNHEVEDQPAIIEVKTETAD